MNKPIRTISIFCLLLFVALLINATWLQYWKADSYDNDGRNRRVIEAAYSRERGAIRWLAHQIAMECVEPGAGWRGSGVRSDPLDEHGFRASAAFVPRCRAG